MKSEKKLQNFSIPPQNGELPKTFKLLSCGKNPLTIAYKDAELHLSEENMATIIKNHESKGHKIPIDCAHAFKMMADSVGMDEDELAKLDPEHAGKATLGFASLSMKDDALFASDVVWNPIGEKLLRAGQFRYFSPMLKGMDHPENLRVTSIALTNEPKLNHLTELAASETALVYQTEPKPETPHNPKEESHMDALKKLLAEVLKIDLATLDTPEGVTAAETALKSLCEKAQKGEEIKKEVQDELGMSEVSPDVIKAHLAGFNALKSSNEALVARVSELEMSESNRKKAALIEVGRQEGKITDATVPFLISLTELQLSDFLKTAPVVVPLGVVTAPSKTDTLAMSEKENEVLKNLGCKPKK